MGAKEIYVIDPINNRVQQALMNGEENVFKSDIIILCNIIN